MSKYQNIDADPSIAREKLVAEAAYYLAERRSFAGGDPEQDWYEAEAEINRQLDEEDEEKGR